MKKVFLSIIAMSMIVPIVVSAGTCDAPTRLTQRPISSHTGTTCGGEIGIPLGGAVATHPSVVYTFRYNPDGPDGASGPMSVAGAEREVVVSESCTGVPLGGFAPGVPVNVDSLGLTSGGTYYLIVTTDLGLAVTAPPRCGDFSMSWGSLPVSLQNFSID